MTTLDESLSPKRSLENESSVLNAYLKIENKQRKTGGKYELKMHVSNLGKKDKCVNTKKTDNKKLLIEMQKLMGNKGWQDIVTKM